MLFLTSLFNCYEDVMIPISFHNLIPNLTERCMRQLDYPASILLQLLLRNYLLRPICMPNPIEQMSRIHLLTIERFLLQTKIFRFIKPIMLNTYFEVFYCIVYFLISRGI